MGLSRVRSFHEDQVLRVAVLSGRELGPCDYRPGDLAVSFAHSMGLRQAGIDHSNVYVQLQVGPETRRTEEARSKPGEKKVTWEKEEHFFDIARADDVRMRLKVLDRKGARRLLLGDPRVGDAIVTLGAEFRDGAPHRIPVAITKAAGSTLCPAGTLDIEVRFEQTYGIAPVKEADFGVMQHKKAGVKGWLYHTVEEARHKFKSMPSTYACMCVNPDGSELESFVVSMDSARLKGEMLEWFWNERALHEIEKAELRLRQGYSLWEFGVTDGFRPFDAECQDIMEAQYQAFCMKAGASVCRVASRGQNIQVDFEAMKQSVVGGTQRFRDVRRRQGPLGGGYA